MQEVETHRPPDNSGPWRKMRHKRHVFQLDSSETKYKRQLPRVFFLLLAVIVLLFSANVVAQTPPINYASGACTALGGTLQGSNLVNNGSFSIQGSISSNISGASTVYTHHTGSGYSDGWPNGGSYDPNDGNYVITSRTGPVLYGISFGSAAWHDTVGVQYATNATDKFMVINADATPGAAFTNFQPFSRIFYCRLKMESNQTMHLSILQMVV